MKTLYSTFLVALLLAGCLVSCKELNDSYEGYVVPGGIVYPGKIKSPELLPGHNRVLITWPQSLDPSVSKARIFWNNYSDSLEVAISPSERIVSVMIENLPEKSYAFVIKTYDEAGNTSVPVEVIGKTFGDLYQESLSNRRIDDSDFEAPAHLTILWAGADIANYAYATEIKYTDTLGRIQVKRFSTTTDTSRLSDIQAGTSYQHRTIYIPESISIDTFYTDYSTREVVTP